MAPTHRVEKGRKTSSGRSQQERQNQRLKSTLFGIGAPKPVPKGAFSDAEITITVRGVDETKPARPIKFFPKFLFSHSPYFRRILEGPDGRPRTYEYTDLSLDANAMGHFAAYCMRDSIDDYAVSPDDNFADILDETIDLYLLAGKLEATALQNLAILKSAALSRRHGLRLRERHVTRIYNETKDAGHPLRRYIAAQYAWNHDAENPRFLSRKTARKMPLDFVYDWGHEQSMRLVRGEGQSSRWDPDVNPQRFCVEVKVEPEVVVLDDAESDGQDGKRKEEEQDDEMGGEDQPISVD